LCLRRGVTRLGAFVIREFEPPPLFWFRGNEELLTTTCTPPSCFRVTGKHYLLCQCWSRACRSTIALRVSPKPSLGRGMLGRPPFSFFLSGLNTVCGLDRHFIPESLFQRVEGITLPFLRWITNPLLELPHSSMVFPRQSPI